MESVQQYPSSMPPQNISSTKKTPKWGINCVRAIKSMATTVDDMGRSSRENKEVNYDLVNSRFLESDFEHVLNPYGINMEKFGGTASKMQNYNIIRSRLETLKGEEMNSPLQFFVYAVSGDAVSAKKQKRKDMLKDMMKAHIRMEFQLDEQIAQIENQQGQLQQVMSTTQDQAKMQELQQQMQQLTDQRNNMPDIQAEMKKFNSKYVDPTEQTNNKLLQYLKRKDNLPLKFNQGWFHALVSAEEVYKVGISRGHPSTRAVNPLQFDYDKGANTTFIQHGNWGKEEYWLPIGETINEFGDVLSDAEVDKISKGLAGNVFLSEGMQQGFAYSNQGGQRRSSFNKYGGAPSHAYIMQVAWRSYTKIGMLTYQDPRTGKEEQVEVDDTFRMPKELKDLGAQLEWEWETEIWEGTQIGSDIFVNVRPVANQTKNLPYIGYIYNNVNSVATSMVDLVKAHQYTYIIVWWRLEQELAKAKGRKFVMDMAQLPKSMGWTVEQWMYYFENLGVVWINSTEEGRKGDPQSVANFNQFQSIDMTLSQVVVQYMQVLAKLEQLVEDIMGVSPQRMGDIGVSETATGAQTSISRSTNVTRPWFYFHDQLKEAVLTEMLEYAKIAYMDGTEMELFLDEMETATLKIDGDKLNGSDMGVFVTNSYEDRQRLDKMEALLSAAVQQGKASLVDVGKALNSNSMSYMLSALDEGEVKATEAAQSAQKSQEQIAQNSLEAQARKEELDRAQEDMLNKRDNDTTILAKKMEIGAKETTQGTELQDMAALHSATLEEEKVDLDKTKEVNRAAEAQRALDIKEKEAKIKEKIANKPNLTPSKK